VRPADSVRAGAKKMGLWRARKRDYSPPARSKDRNPSSECDPHRTGTRVRIRNTGQQLTGPEKRCVRANPAVAGGALPHQPERTLAAPVARSATAAGVRLPTLG